VVSSPVSETKKIGCPSVKPASVVGTIGSTFNPYFEFSL
jgi:hypothetical protein